MTISVRAKLFATKMHAECQHRRKYTDEPYITHPADVVAILSNFSANRPSEDAIAAAWLHDVVEDCGVELATIRRMFGQHVAELVEQLTDVSKPEHGNRATRKEIDRAHTAAATPEAKSIKLADLISNSASIVQHDPKFARTYMEEKRLLLKVLGAGDVNLYKLAQHMVDDYFKKNPKTGEQVA